MPFLLASELASGDVPDRDEIERERSIAEPDRNFAAFDGPDIVGTAGAFTMPMTVPGGRGRGGLPDPGRGAAHAPAAGDRGETDARPARRRAGARRPALGAVRVRGRDLRPVRVRARDDRGAASDRHRPLGVRPRIRGLRSDPSGRPRARRQGDPRRARGDATRHLRDGAPGRAPAGVRHRPRARRRQATRVVLRAARGRDRRGRIHDVQGRAGLARGYAEQHAARSRPGGREPGRVRGPVALRAGRRPRDVRGGVEPAQRRAALPSDARAPTPARADVRQSVGAARRRPERARRAEGTRRPAASSSRSPTRSARGTRAGTRSRPQRTGPRS